MLTEKQARAMGAVIASSFSIKAILAVEKAAPGVPLTEWDIEQLKDAVRRIDELEAALMEEADHG